MSKKVRFTNVSTNEKVGDLIPVETKKALYQLKDSLKRSEHRQHEQAQKVA